MSRHIVRKATFFGDFINALFLKDPYLELVPGDGNPKPKGSGYGRSLDTAEAQESSSPEALTGEQREETTLPDSKGHDSVSTSQPAAADGLEPQAEEVLQPFTKGQLRLIARFLSRHVLMLRAGLDNDLLTQQYQATDIPAMEAAAFVRAMHAAKSLEAMADLHGETNEEQGFLLYVVAQVIRERFQSNFETLAVEAQFAARQREPVGQSSKASPAAELVGTLVHLTDLTPERIAAVGFNVRESQILHEIIEGETYENIAGKNGTEVTTVKTIVGNACVRLGVSGREELESALRLMCIRQAEETFHAVRGMLKRDLIEAVKQRQKSTAEELGRTSGPLAASRADVPHRI